MPGELVMELRQFVVRPAAIRQFVERPEIGAIFLIAPQEFPREDRSAGVRRWISRSVAYGTRDRARGAFRCWTTLAHSDDSARSVSRYRSSARAHRRSL